MRKLGIAALALLCLGMASCVTGEEAAIQRAYRKMAPCLVFVKPIQEDLSWGEKEAFQVFGSGSIISEDGYIVTNNHVAEKAKEITCVLYNKEEVKAEVVGLDPEADIAVLKLDKDDLARVMKETGIAKLPVASWGDSNTLKDGQSVIALGAPFGFTRSLTKGVVSSMERYFSDFPHHLWIQTDASINPGNSGGPLVNMKGEIVGINTLGIFGSGMGFAIPSNVASEIVNRIIADKKVIRAYFGLTFQAIHDFTRSSHLNAKEGVLIGNVDRGSPAEEAGMRAGDILLSCDGVPVNALYETDLPVAYRFFAYKPVGVAVNLVVKRKEETLTFNLAPIEKGKFEGEEFECRDWNMVVKEITKDSTPYLHFLRPKGVYIMGVRYNGNASSSGLSRGDILMKLDTTEIESLEQFKGVYEELSKRPKGKRRIPVVVNRSGLEVLVILDYEKNIKAAEEEYE